jgi:hypothetical protein
MIRWLGSYAVAVLVSWYGLIVALVGLLRLVEWLWGRTLIASSRVKLIFALAMLFVAQASAYRALEKEKAKSLVAEPCPPNPMTFFKGENVLMDPAKGQLAWRLSEGEYRPPGVTSPFSARITVMGPEAILWSDDAGPPNRIATVNAELWVCGDRVAKFRARPNGPNSATLMVSYVR